MHILEKIRIRAKERIMTIVLPEGEDDRTLVAANKILSEKIANLIILGNPDQIQTRSKALGLNLNAAGVIDPVKSSSYSDYVQKFIEIRKAKGITIEEAENTIKNPLFFGAMMVRSGDADGSVAGAINTTANVVRAGIQIIGLKEGISLLSSFFMMVLPKPDFGANGVILYADGAVVPDPDAPGLADIAITTAASFKNLVGEEPRVAMLSFSTYGSAKHKLLDKVLEATKIAKKKAPKLILDGELQVDAAIIPEIAKRKAAGSPVEGRANVFIFPDLNAGNIAYKITERLAGAEAIGPIIQGLKRPSNDLSRGCKAEDIVNVVSIAAVQAQEAVS